MKKTFHQICKATNILTKGFCLTKNWSIEIPSFFENKHKKSKLLAI
jgi:hypothetical protein